MARAVVPFFELHLLRDLRVPVGLGAAAPAVGEPEHLAVSEAMQDTRLEGVAVCALRSLAKLLLNQGTNLCIRSMTYAHETVEALYIHKRKNDVPDFWNLVLIDQARKWRRRPRSVRDFLGRIQMRRADRAWASDWCAPRHLEPGLTFL